MNSWSFNIGKIAGIDLKVHWTFLLLLVFYAWSSISHTGEWLAGLYSVVFILTLFGIIVLHELGHALAARRYNIATRDITLLPIGGVARLADMPREPWKEFVIAIAGPAVNVAIGIILLPVYWIFASESVFLFNLFWVNLIMIAFNLIPALPMDGGRVLRSLLATRLGHYRGTKTASLVAKVVAFGFAVFGFFYNPLLMLIAAFVYLGAVQEERAAEYQEQLERRRNHFERQTSGLRDSDILLVGPSETGSQIQILSWRDDIERE